MSRRTAAPAARRAWLLQHPPKREARAKLHTYATIIPAASPDLPRVHHTRSGRDLAARHRAALAPARAVLLLLPDAENCNQTPPVARPRPQKKAARACLAEARGSFGTARAQRDLQRAEIRSVGGEHRQFPQGRVASGTRGRDGDRAAETPCHCSGWGRAGDTPGEGLRRSTAHFPWAIIL